MRSASIGHVLFAIAMIVVGAVGLISGDFTAVWQGAPQSLPGHQLLAYACAIVSLAGGVGLLFQRTATFSARVLFVSLLLWLLLFKFPFILRAPLVEGSYQTNGETATIVAGAWVLYAWFATEWEKRRLALVTGDNGVRIARVLYALAMIAFGLSHFFYVQLTAPLVPSWLPAHTEFAYFTGGAYLAAGIAILIGVFARLAAALSTLQMGLFTLLIWVPMVVSGQISAFQSGEFIVSCVLTAAGWVITDSYRDKPWFALFKL